MKSSGEFQAKKARARLKSAVKFDPSKIVLYPFKPFDFRFAYLDEAIHPLFSRPSPELLSSRPLKGITYFITRDTADKDPEGPPFYYSRLVCDYDCISGHARHFPTRVLPPKPKGQKQGQMALLGDISFPMENLSSNVRRYLKNIDISDPDSLEEIIPGIPTSELIWLHALAIGYSPLYLAENGDGIRQDWPRIPLPAGRSTLLDSAQLGRKVADLLDTEKPILGVTTGAINPELKSIATLSKLGGGNLDPNRSDFALTAGWGHAGKDGVTMPAKGKLAKRSQTPAETGSDRFGPGTLDVFLNERAYWRNIPVQVWEYTIGGYQVIKKWLSYREKELLGRDLSVEEAKYVTEMARRIAALILLQTELDANYQSIRQDYYPWPTNQG
jgi:hypothetical protein